MFCLLNVIFNVLAKHDLLFVNQQLKLLTNNVRVTYDNRINTFNHIQFIQYSKPDRYIDYDHKHVADTKSGYIFQK